MTPQKKSRQMQAKETKLHIFDTALLLLQKKKFEEITVRDIVQEANVSIGTFYHYYESKLDVFFETYHLADDYFEEQVAPALRNKTTTEQILCFFDYYAWYSSEYTDISLTKILYNSNNTCFNRESTHGMMPILTQIIAGGLAKGDLEGDPSASEIAKFFLIAARGLVYNWCTENGSYSLRAAMRKYIKRLIRTFWPRNKISPPYNR